MFSKIYIPAFKFKSSLQFPSIYYHAHKIYSKFYFTFMHTKFTRKFSPKKGSVYISQYVSASSSLEERHILTVFPSNSNSIINRHFTSSALVSTSFLHYTYVLSIFNMETLFFPLSSTAACQLTETHHWAVSYSLNVRANVRLDTFRLCPFQHG